MDIFRLNFPMKDVKIDTHAKHKLYKINKVHLALSANILVDIRLYKMLLK